MGWEFDRCAGHLALDFANTMTQRHTDAPIERLPSYAELVSFALQSAIVEPPRAGALLARAGRRPEEAAAALATARELREALYALFSAVARGEAPSPADVATLDGQLPRLSLAADLSLSWRTAPESLDDFLGAVVLAALELASRPAERARVRLCEAPDCVWLFYDSSRNRSRRWCDMRQCGNRMKARRHYARQK